MYNILTVIVILHVTESTRCIFGVNVMSQSDLSVKLKGQTKKAHRWTKGLVQKKDNITSMNS